jgi:hypothetical protein
MPVILALRRQRLGGSRYEINPEAYSLRDPNSKKTITKEGLAKKLKW